MEGSTITLTPPASTSQREVGEGRERVIVLLRDEFSCVYCGCSPIQDGVKIYSDRLDGEAPNVFKNQVTVCSKCGEVKGSLPLSKTMLAKFAAIIADRSRRFIEKRRHQHGHRADARHIPPRRSLHRYSCSGHLGHSPISNSPMKEQSVENIPRYMLRIHVTRASRPPM